MKTTLTAGGVVVGPDGKIVVVSQAGDSWSLPKGHVEPNETAVEAAEREITEETGIHQLRLIDKIGTYERYRIGKHGRGEDTTERKKIVMYAFSTPERRLAPIDPANPEAEWVDPDQVAERLTHPADKAFYLQAWPRIQQLLK